MQEISALPPSTRNKTRKGYGRKLILKPAGYLKTPPTPINDAHQGGYLGCVMRYLIIDRDYCVFKADVISGKTRQALKDGLISIIDVKRMEGMDINGWDFSPVQDWYIDMLDDELSSPEIHQGIGPNITH